MLARLPLIALVLANALTAQISLAREQVRERLREIGFAKSLTTLVELSGEFELAGANYSIDDGADTELSTIVLPFQQSVAVWGPEAPQLYLEAALGYARAQQRIDDIYAGLLPGGETDLKSDWTTVSGIAGVGLSVPIADGLDITPIVDLGLTWIQNDTDYGGPGAGVTAAVFDGLAFNWDGLALVVGGAMRVDWRQDLGSDHQLEVVGRYDLRWVDMIEYDDVAQDFATTSHLATLRTDVTGPCGLTLAEHELNWRATAGYRWLIDDDMFGIRDYFWIGGGLELPTGDDLPLISEVTLSAAAILGEEVTGWTIGLGVSF